jgi:hypothetical protein
MAAGAAADFYSVNLMLLTALVSLPAVAFAWLLSRRRSWRALAIFLAVGTGIMAFALVAGHRDYVANKPAEGVISDWDMGTHLWLFAVLGMIAIDWLALIWGAIYWFRRSGAKPAHRTRADRRREMKSAAVAGQSQGMTK